MPMKDMERHIKAMKHFVPFLLFLCLATTCTPAHTPFPSTPHHNLTQSHHFVLVHGAGHGAWCWYKVATLLTLSGHNVTTLDLAASGINPKQIQQVRSFSDYVEPLIEFIESLPPKDRVILVGHSMGGAAISIAMEKFPQKISAAVFATAFMPGPNLSYPTIFEKVFSRMDLMDSQYRYDDGPKNPPTSALVGPKFAATSFYQLSPPDDLTLALTLMRFSPLLGDEIELTWKNYGSVRRVFIVCSQDHAIEVDQQRWMIKKNPPHEVIVINGSDHMVMFSKTWELFSNLQKIGEKYP